MVADGTMAPFYKFSGLFDSWLDQKLPNYQFCALNFLFILQFYLKWQICKEKRHFYQLWADNAAQLSQKLLNFDAVLVDRVLFGHFNLKLLQCKDDHKFGITVQR